MNTKKLLFFSSISILVVAMVFSSSVCAQDMRFWDYCKVSAYVYNFVELETGTIRSISFNVDTPPSGSDIPNTLEIKDYVTGENYSMTLSPDDAIVIRYDDYPPIHYTYTQGEDSNHYIIYFEGAAVNVTLFGVVVPEFPSILAIPIFMIATLLAIIYRRKQKT